MSSRVIPIVMDAGALSDAARNASDKNEALTNAQPAPVWVWVNNSPISEAAIAHEMQHHRHTDPHESRASAVRALVINELLRLEAVRCGLDQEVIEEADETPDEVYSRLLIERYAQPEAIDEASSHQWFENNREKMRTPDRVRARHILLACAPDDVAGRDSARTSGEQLIQNLRSAPERFAEFAMRHSACPSREDGGDLGWLERGSTVPEFERQLLMLKPGLAGLTLETRYGHHVVQVDEIVRGEYLSYAQARSRVLAYLETQSQQMATHAYLMQLCERYPVKGMQMPTPSI